jgi:hypothetical protein
MRDKARITALERVKRPDRAQCPMQIRIPCATRRDFSFVVFIIFFVIDIFIDYAKILDWNLIRLD